MESAGSIFGKEGKDKEAQAAERRQEELYKPIGQLQAENDFLKKIPAPVRDRAEAIEVDHPILSILRQCGLLDISRTAYYYRPHEINDDRDLTVLLAIMDELPGQPFYRYRKIALAAAFLGVTRKQVRRIIKRTGLRSIYPGKRLSQPDLKHQKYPYLLKDKAVWLPNQVWASDITYIRLTGGYVYLVTILDLYSRKMPAEGARVESFEQARRGVLRTDARGRHRSLRRSNIMNMDQGCHYASLVFTGALIKRGI